MKQIPPGTLPYCRICGKETIRTFFDLGSQPLANSLLNNPNEKEESYPLALAHCSTCGLTQLNYTVPPEQLFSQYVWVTGTSSTAREYAEVFCERVLKNLGEKKGYVLELASNDGTFLKPFIGRGYEVLGIDPAKNIAEIANKDGIPTEAIFWGQWSAEQLVAQKGTAQVIFARNVLPHVNDQRDFIQGAHSALSEDGLLVIEAHDARIIQKELHYDSIYHEHMCYFTFSTLEWLLNDLGFYIFDLEKSPISGGSMVVYARKQKGEESAAVKERRAQEQAENTNTKEAWELFAKKSFAHKDAFRSLIEDAQKRGERVTGYGASARSSTLLNFCNIGTTLIPIIADKSSLKQKKYTAGTHIPIESPEIVMAGKPEVMVLLAWNFTEEIIKYLKNDFGFSGNYIIPFPGDSRRT